MIDTIYIEREVAAHPRAQQICARFPEAVQITCDRYSEIFNRKAQNFRLQKRRPALILANKFDHYILEAPTDYGIGSEYNFYFSHMLNCLYDCRYCFLQGMFRSAHYVVFVNYEDFTDAIAKKIKQLPDKDVFFFSGYDCDSLALEPITGFVDHFLPFFRGLPNAWIELRTKSTQIRRLMALEPVKNCVVAMSFTPAELATALEHKAPSVDRRIEAMAQLQKRGWKLGVRFDPLIFHEDYKEQYRRLFDQVFEKINADSLHSVSLGSFRLPRPFYRTMSRLYPDEKLFAAASEDVNGMISYRKSLKEEIEAFCEEALLGYIPRQIYFPCRKAI